MKRIYFAALIACGTALSVLFTGSNSLAQSYCAPYSMQAKVITSTNYKLSLTDACRMLVMTSDDAIVKVPPVGASGDFLPGYTVKIFNASTSTITLEGTINGVQNPTIPRGYSSDLAMSPIAWYAPYTSANPVSAGGGGSPSVGPLGAIQLSDNSGGFNALVPGGGISSWIADPTSAKLLAALTTKTGTGTVVFDTSPTLVTPNLGTPSAINLANATNIPTGQITGNLAVSLFDTGTNASSTTCWRGNGHWVDCGGLPAGVDGDIQVNNLGIFGSLTPASGVSAFLVSPLAGIPSTWLQTGVAVANLGFTPPPNTRAVNTSGLLTGGGNLTTDRTISISAQAACTVVGNAAIGSAVPTAVPVGTGLACAGGQLTATGGGGGAPTVADTHGNSVAGATTVNVAKGSTVSGTTPTATISQTNEISTQTGTTYTLQATDANTTVHFTNVSSVTVTLLAGATLGNGYAVNFQCDAGCTINRAGSDTINGATSLAVGAHQTAALWSDGTAALGALIAPALDPANASNLSSGTVADARLSANVAKLASVNTFTAALATTPVTGGSVTGTVTPDANAGNDWTYTLTGNITLANPTNVRAGETLNFELTQDATGSRTIALGSSFKFSGGAAPTWSTAASKVDYMSCRTVTTSRFTCSAMIDVR